MTTADATRQLGRPVHRGKAASWLSKVFAFHSAGLNWARGVMILDVLLVPLVVFWAIGHEEYLVSTVFGALFAALVDPGGSYPSRALSGAVFGLVGAALTALGFGSGTDAWGWLVFAVSAVTLVASLAVMFGAHRAVAGLLLNIWFIIALALATTLNHTGHTSHTWAQVVAWASGSAIWIAVTFFAWLIRGRKDVARPIAEIPGDTSRRPLTRPVIMFAVLRTTVMAGATALAYGLDLSHGEWLQIAAIIAMRPTLQASTVIAVQRIAGALIGAAGAVLLLLIPANVHGRNLVSITVGLEVVAIVAFMHAAAIRFWNYAVYTAAVAAGVLILIDLPQPSDYGAEGYRVLWTLCGVAMGVLVMVPATLLAKRTAEATPLPAAQRG